MSLFTRWRKKTNPESSGARDDSLREAMGPIGLDIAASSLGFCQLQSRPDGRYRVLAKYRIDFDGERQQLLEDQGRFRSLVQQALRSKPFGGRRVCASVPPDRLRILPISYRARVENPDQEILRLVEQRLKQPAEELVVDYLPLRRHPDDEEHVVLASAAERQYIDRLLKLLTSAGLEPVALDIGPAAIKRLVSTLNRGQDDRLALVVNTGHKNSFLTVVSGRRLLLDQAIGFSGGQLLDSLSESLRLPADKVLALIEANGLDPAGCATAEQADTAATLREIVKPDFLRLKDEIQRVLLYTAADTRGQPLSRLDLLGCVARWPGAWKLLMELLGLDLPVPDIDFRDIFIDDNDQTQPWANQLPEMAIATGLALRGIDTA